MSDQSFPISPSTSGTAQAFAVDTELGSNRNIPHNVVAHYNFPVSTLNSNTSNLSGSAAFIGQVENAGRHMAAQVAVFADKAVQIEVIQFSDEGGTRETDRKTFTRAANKGFCEVVNLNDWYFRVVVTNLEVTATTIFSLQTSQGPLVAGPKTVGPYGGLPVEIVGRGEENSHYFAALAVAPTVLTTGANLLVLRNSGTSKLIKVQKLEVLAYFIGTAAASRSMYALRKQSGVKTTGAGTAVVPAKGNVSAEASIAELKFNLGASIALTGGAAPATNENLAHFGHANQLTANVTYDMDFTDAPIILQPNVALFLQTDGAIVAGSSLHIGLRWVEE